MQKTASNIHKHHSFWGSVENRQRFLGDLEQKLNIKKPSDWGNVTLKDIDEHGGSALLGTYYSSSLFSCLKSNYKDIEWKRDWFPSLPSFHRSYWASMENRKKFLDDIAFKLNIKKPSDWGKITVREIHKLSGGSLLTTYYNNSLFACLQSVYKDVNWKKEWFSKLPNSYWKSIENRRNFLDQLQKKLNLEKPSDWGKVTIQTIYESGGSTLLSNYYNNSLYNCLQSVYKEIGWKREWFPSLPKFSNSDWESMEIRRKFMDGIAKSANIDSLNDWRKVSLAFILSNGGKGLLRKYQSSMSTVLKAVYPCENWNGFESKLASSEARLQGLIERVFPSESVLLHHRKNY